MPFPGPLQVQGPWNFFPRQLLFVQPRLHFPDTYHKIRVLKIFFTAFDFSIWRDVLSDSVSIQALKAQWSSCLAADRAQFQRRLQGIQKLPAVKQTKILSILQDETAKALARAVYRKEHVPDFEYPELPVSEKHAEIADAIRNNQVVIVAGETGSGKTTQLPKICLEAGRGREGMIGHTQPRRLAARSVASRIAEELQCEFRITSYNVCYTKLLRIFLFSMQLTF